jgi:hypothetical protein
MACPRGGSSGRRVGITSSTGRAVVVFNDAAHRTSCSTRELRREAGCRSAGDDACARTLEDARIRGPRARHPCPTQSVTCWSLSSDGSICSRYALLGRECRWYGGVKAASALAGRVCWVIVPPRPRGRGHGPSAPGHRSSGEPQGAWSRPSGVMRRQTGASWCVRHPRPAPRRGRAAHILSTNGFEVCPYLQLTQWRCYDWHIR